MRNAKHSVSDRKSNSARHPSPSDRKAEKAKRIRAKWSARILRQGSLTGPAFIEFTFPTKGGGTSQFRANHSDMRSRHLNTLLDQFSNYLPIFPADVDRTDAAQGQFIQELVAGTSKSIELLPERTGFVDPDTFVTHSEILRADGTRTPVPGNNDARRHTFVDIKGTLQGTTDLVLKLANESTYLAFGIGVALAAPLPSYVSLRRAGDDDLAPLVRETAAFNLSGTSSSGKSSVCLAAMTLAGSPDRAGTLDFSRRGLAEMASDSNDLLLVLDDTEKAEDGPGALVTNLKGLVHVLPGGRSKNIARGADKYPPLRWSTFGLSSSPRSIERLARENRWKMTAGDKVRLFNISVPGPGKGGIFDSIDCKPADRAKRSIELISKLERGYSNHCGHVIPAWVIYLMAEDRSGEIIKRVNSFIEHVEARGHGWEVRFAQKFGVIYAAMMMGIDAGLLPWPRGLPREVVTKVAARHATPRRPTKSAPPKPLRNCTTS
jgi:putative DNA primase/helicase